MKRRRVTTSIHVSFYPTREERLKEEEGGKIENCGEREREREREKEERETLVDTGKFVLTSYIRMKLARSISGLSSLLRSSSKERRELAVFQNERDKRNTC